VVAVRRSIQNRGRPLSISSGLLLQLHRSGSVPASDIEPCHASAWSLSDSLARGLVCGRGG
jgi:hypothetical protein